MEEVFPGVYRIKDRIATKSYAPGFKVYKEETIVIDGIEYRFWDPYKSKLSAAIIKGLTTFKFKKDSTILYLGAASGTTVSHISDIVTDGIIFAVEFSPRPFRDLMQVVEHRPHIIPILADARLPYRYRIYIPSVDLIYCDIAQPDQTQILIKNAKAYLKKGGYIYYAIKSRSIDVVKTPRQIYDEQLEILKREGFEVVDQVELDPFEKEHLMAVLTLPKK